MPLHRIFVPRNLYSEEDKQAISTAITETVYGRLPSFYVVVLFITVEKGDYYVGAKQRDNFVRFAVENMARTFEGEKLKREFIGRYEKALEPWTKARGIDWEVQIEECNRIMWNMNAVQPPPFNSEGEKIWKAADKVVPIPDENSARL